MGGRRRCCCKRGCVTITDDFNRPDAETPGEDWEVASGTWGLPAASFTKLARPVHG